MPAGAILSADVAGERVKPVQGPDGSRVPLLRPGFRPTDSYTVSFVFMHSGAPFAKKGDSQLSLPKMDIPISFMQWEVFPPEQYKVRDFAGDALAANLLPPSFQNATEGLDALHPGQLGWTVTDPSGAVIPGVKVTVTSSTTGIKKTTTTDSSGPLVHRQYASW